MDNDLYTIGELAAAIGVTERTIRYYTTEKLLPEPDSSRYPATYTRRHLRRLQLILRFKEAFVPLDVIRQKVASLSEDDVERELARPTSVPGSAADYIAGLRAAQQSTPAPAPSMNPTSGSAKILNRARKAASSLTPSGETWQRFVLSPDLEIHARLPISTETQALLDALPAYVQSLQTSETAPKDRKETHP